MVTRVFCLVLTTVFTAAAIAADAVFPVDFQEALRLSRIPDQAATAEAAFLELAARQMRDSRGPDAAWEQAALCAMRRQNYEEAGQRAGRIKEEPLRMLCRMRIRDAQRRWAEMLEDVGNQDFAAWPDRLIFDAAMCRGRAHAALGNAAAEQDFLLARAATCDANQLALANLNLGNFYRDQVKDDAKALTAYQKAAESSVTGAAKYDSVIACAGLLAKQGEEQKAVDQLDQLDVDTINSADWRCRIYQAYGDVYAALKRPADALAAYRKARDVPGVSDYMVKTVEGRIAGMTP